MGRYVSNPDILRWEDPPLIWAISSTGSLEKGRGKRKLVLPLCQLALYLPTKSIPSLALDQLRHLALWTKQPLDSWTFHL